MSLFEFLILLAIAGICGAIGQALAGYSHGGCLATIAVGFIGALGGQWIARRLDLPELFNVRVDEIDFPVIWSIAGSALFVAILSLFHRAGGRRPRP